MVFPYVNDKSIRSHIHRSKQNFELVVSDKFIMTNKWRKVTNFWFCKKLLSCINDSLYNWKLLTKWKFVVFLQFLNSWISICYQFHIDIVIISREGLSLIFEQEAAHCSKWHKPKFFYRLNFFWIIYGWPDAI